MNLNPSDPPCPVRAAVLLSEALAHLADHLDYRPALVTLDRLKVEVALEPAVYPEGTLELINHARGIVDDDPEAAYQELWAIVDSWIKRWPSLA